MDERMSNYVALDCEFVSTGRGIEALGRCSIINYDGSVLYDSYVRPALPITDYRTRWSGIRPRDMKCAMSEYTARHMIINLLKGKVIIGHGLRHDFKVLGFHPPYGLVRDTALYRPLRELAQLHPMKEPSLKNLAMAILGVRIQHREHCSIEDASAALQLYKVVQRRWEADINVKMDAKRPLNYFTDTDNTPMSTDQFCITMIVLCVVFLCFYLAQVK